MFRKAHGTGGFFEQLWSATRFMWRRDTKANRTRFAPRGGPDGGGD